MAVYRCQSGNGGGKSASDVISSFTGTISLNFKPKRFLVYCPAYNDTSRCAFYYDEDTDASLVIQDLNNTVTNRSSATDVIPSNSGITFSSTFTPYINGHKVYYIASE